MHFMCQFQITTAILLMQTISKTHCGRVMAYSGWIHIVSGDGLLPDGTKPLPESMWTYHQLDKLERPFWEYPPQ